MKKIILIEPTVDYAEDIWQFRQEILNSDDADKFAGCGQLRQCCSAEEWINLIQIRKNPVNLPEGMVPSTQYIAVRTCDNRIVGAIDLRHHIDHPILSVWGGHIGYYVRPAERRKGYGKEMLRLNLENARLWGIPKVLDTCSASNPGSEKTILACGGEFEKNVLVDGETIKRYWINTAHNIPV